MLLAICSAVVVFPHHFAPSMSTAPFPANLRCSRLSATLFLYIFSISFHHHDCCKNTNNLSNSPIWPKTVRPFGQKLFAHLTNIYSSVWPIFAPQLYPICTRTGIDISIHVNFVYLSCPALPLTVFRRGIVVLRYRWSSPGRTTHSTS